MSVQTEATSSARANANALLEPRSVAVIGASQHAHKPGAVLLRSLIEGGFAGEVYPIHPRADEVLGQRAYPSVAEVPGQIDLAFIVLARESVRTAVQQCAEAGVGGVVIVSAGFNEADEWGVREQAAIAEILDRHDMQALGPNTIGLVTMGGRLRGSFVHFPTWNAGDIAMAAQSGVFAGSVAEEEIARRTQRLGVHASVALGNRIRTSETDLVRSFGDNPEVGVIGLYLESFADAEAFLRTAAEVKRRKPIVLLKGGRTRAGSLAAASHTGSLAADDAVVDQLLRQHGVVRAQGEDEFLALLKGFSYSPGTTGKRVGVVTFSGAYGVLACDHLDAAGLELPDYSEQTVSRFSELLPGWQRPRNPADLWPAIDVDPRRALIDGLGAALADPGVDQVFGILLAVGNSNFPGMAEALAQLRREYPDKPIHLTITGGYREQWLTALEGLSIPVYDSISLAVSVIRATAWYHEVRDVLPSAYASTEGAS